MRRLRAAMVTLLLWVQGGGLAQAQTRAAEASSLSWTRLAGAEACPAVNEIARRVEVHLGRAALVAPSAAQSFVDASIQPLEPRGFRVRIALSTDTEHALGVREFAQDTADCAQVADAAALAIALMIDPNAAQRQDAAVAPVAVPAPVAAPVVALPEVRASALPAAAAPSHERDRSGNPQPSHHWRTRVGLGPVGATGQLPSWAWGVLGTVRLSPQNRRVGLDLEGFYLAGQRVGLRTGAGGGFAAAAAGVAGWWAPLRREAWAVSGGAGVQVGGMVASGFGFTQRTSYAQSVLVNAVLDVDFAWTAFEPWGLLARASLGFPLRRDLYEATQAGEPTLIFQPAAVVGAFSLGVSFEP